MRPPPRPGSPTQHSHARSPPHRVPNRSNPSHAGIDAAVARLRDAAHASHPQDGAKKKAPARRRLSVVAQALADEENGVTIGGKRVHSSVTDEELEALKADAERRRELGELVCETIAVGADLGDHQWCL